MFDWDAVVFVLGGGGLRIRDSGLLGFEREGTATTGGDWWRRTGHGCLMEV